MNPEITVIHDLPPEDIAMLQALYSRSPANVEEHLDKLNARGSGRFMERYYIGYGHDSIGDCGVTTIFIEGVTMLCAKAIQDWPLYSGQEASTRYMDFSSVEFFDPMSTRESEAIQERWREFYLDAREPLRRHLLQKYPRQEGEDEGTYERAIKARVFDVLRAFLPAGAATNLSWTTNLRQAKDHLQWLVEHPDQHVRETAWGVVKMLRANYRNSFPAQLQTDEQSAWRKSVLTDCYYTMPQTHSSLLGTRLCENPVVSTSIDEGDISRRVLEALACRPRGTAIPWYLDRFVNISAKFNLDFGSFRDLQRHRNGTIHMPLLTTRLGFHPWYYNEMPEDLRVKARTLVEEQTTAINELDCTEVTRQNFMAMGFMVTCHVSQGLSGYVYRLELRSSKSVHPTLRSVVLKEIEVFRNRFPSVALHVDTNPDHWTVRRGDQTIVER